MHGEAVSINYWTDLSGIGAKGDVYPHGPRKPQGMLPPSLLETLGFEAVRLKKHLTPLVS